MKPALIGLLLLLFSASGALAREAWNLGALMTVMAKVTRSEARFREERHVHYLSEPLVSRGKLFYQAAGQSGQGRSRPSTLLKQVTVPRIEKTTITDYLVVIESPETGQRQQLDARDHPLLLAFVTALNATLAGDETRLRALFDITFTGPRDGWRMRLTPNQESLRDAVAMILLQGENDKLQRFEMRETGGDRTIVIMEPTGSGAQ